MQSFDNREMRNVFEPMKISTKFVLLAALLLFVLGLTLLGLGSVATRPSLGSGNHGDDERRVRDRRGLRIV